MIGQLSLEDVARYYQGAVIQFNGRYRKVVVTNGEVTLQGYDAGTRNIRVSASDFCNATEVNWPILGWRCIAGQPFFGRHVRRGFCKAPIDSGIAWAGGPHGSPYDVAGAEVMQQVLYPTWNTIVPSPFMAIVGGTAYLGQNTTAKCSVVDGVVKVVATKGWMRNLVSYVAEETKFIKVEVA